MHKHLLLFLLLIVFCFSCSEGPTTSNYVPPVDTFVNYTYTVVQSFPHDEKAYTQGFVYMDSLFYEGTGLYAKSSLRQVDPESGTVLKIEELESKYFGEGITIFNDKIYQLTWKNNIGFIYDYSTFDSLDEFTYDTEGWGLTHNGHRLIMSDGSDKIYFINPDNMQIESQIEVHGEDGPAHNINELEYISGKIYANIWLTNYIIIIDPASGLVTAKIDLTGLLDPADIKPTTDWLNGIAYDEQNDRLFVTGKKWPKVFEIVLEEFSDN